MTVGCLVLRVSLRARRHRASACWTRRAAVVFGLGMGMIFVPLFDIIMGDIEDHEVGSASGMLESSSSSAPRSASLCSATVFFHGLDLGPRAHGMLDAAYRCRRRSPPFTLC